MLGEAEVGERDKTDARLSPREREVLCLIAAGLTGEAIAARLDVSRHAVVFHCRSLFKKTGTCPCSGSRRRHAAAESRFRRRRPAIAHWSIAAARSHPVF
jgi:ATP/maltotriose-dependent transcriptional regulator MalT